MDPMSGFVEELANRDEAVERVSYALSFPWYSEEENVSLGDAFGRRLARDIRSPESFPPFSRSLRDGYAVLSDDVVGASPSAPVFLDLGEEVPMGQCPAFRLGIREASLIHTGGVLPVGSDAVVMLEDVEASVGLVEIRASVQAGENVMPEGEELLAGAVVGRRGDLLDHRALGLLAALGISRVPCLRVTVGIISTGDEVVDMAVEKLPPGCIRDANSWFLSALLRKEGFYPVSFGIVSDKEEDLSEAIASAQTQCDVLLVSGGSSVSIRDHVSQIFSKVPSPGLLVRGLNLSPGKPTLLAGSLNPRKLLLGLPGHPLSCAIVALAVLKPLLLRLVGSEETQASSIMEAGADIFGRAGLEEFLPGAVRSGRAVPLTAKSGFVGALRSATHLIRLPQNTETIRKGEEVELWPL